MPEIMRQRRFGVRTTFSFGPDALTYGIGDWNSVRTETIPYEALDLTSRGEYCFGNTGYGLRWSVFLLPLYLLLLALPAIWFEKALAAALLLAAVLAATIMFEWTEVRFTEFATFGTDQQGVRGFLRVIQDKQHDRLVAELERHWRDRLRRLHGTLSLDADPQEEATRFDRLRQLGVIDDAEFRTVLDRLRAAVSASTAGTDRRLH